MIRLLSAASLIAMLAACDNAQPFTFGAEEDEATDETPETVVGEDPNETPNSLFLFDPEANLVLNAVTYDEDNDRLIINNLPFDGPGIDGGRYDFLFAGSEGQRFYENLQTYVDSGAPLGVVPETGVFKHYAAFVRTDLIEAVAANSTGWAGFGYAGANVNRTTYTIAGSGEYVYVGTYAGVREFGDGQSIDAPGYELTEGDALIFVDVDDFDPTETVQGSVAGRIINHTRVPNPNDSATPTLPQDWNSTRALPTIQLGRTSFNTADGTFREGPATTYGLDGDVRDSGLYEGVLAGEGSTDIGGYISVTGVANEQRVQYDVAYWELTVSGTRTVLGITVPFTETTTGTAEGLTENNEEQVQTLIDRGLTVPYLNYNPVDVPSGATILRVETETRDFATEFEAREVGVFAADRVDGESITIP